MTVSELRDILIRQGRSSVRSDALMQAMEDREALLVLAKRLADALREVAERCALDRCPLCGDPECPAPLLEVLESIQVDGLGKIL